MKITTHVILLLIVIISIITHSQSFNYKPNHRKKQGGRDESSNSYLKSLKSILKDRHENMPMLDEAQLAYANEIKRFIKNSSFNILENLSCLNRFKNKGSFLSLATNLKSTFPDSDTPSSFFKSGTYETVLDNLPTSANGKTCWSGSYWAMEHLLISSRYGRKTGNNIGVWSDDIDDYDPEYSYAQSVPMIDQPREYNSILDQGILQTKCNSWSPSEKFDMLVGDKDFTLTNWMKWKSKKYVKNGEIPSWYGICHGWTIASYYYPQPKNYVELMASDKKTKIHFYQDDIKALASQFWATCKYTSGFIGTTCRHRDPSKIPSDPGTGLWIDPHCSSVDAGAFLIVLANQMGINKLNLNIDPHQDDEIWNQPLYSYKFEIFDLFDDYIYDLLTDNFNYISDIVSSNDPFMRYLYKYKPDGAIFVTGLWIQITYAVESEPIPSDHPNENYTKDKEFLGALYLDRKHNILAGKWMYNDHPQFAWKAEESVKPQGTDDHKCDSFDGTPGSLDGILDAIKNSSSNGIPIKCVVEKLIQMSQ